VYEPGAIVRISASSAIEAARWLARSERSPSASACIRQQIRLIRFGRLLQRVVSPKTSSYLTRSRGVVSVPGRLSSA
jgi:hypothetical protein